MDIENKVISFINRNNLIPKNIHRIYVAVSGGADSMALLAFLHHNTNQQIVAVHINHGIRDVTADRDQQFVEDYCKENYIPCVVFNAKTDGIVIPEHPSEDWARNLRYKYFDTLNMHHAVVATAHTSSDQAETALFRLSRGCGLNGMSCIKAKRDYFIRPFLCISRKETETLSEYYQTGYITDESNLTDDYSRNKIRHHIIPVLNGINTNAVANITKTCNRISNAYDFIHEFALNQLDVCMLSQTKWYDTSLVKQNHIAVISEMLAILLSDFECKDTVIETAVNHIISCDCNIDEYKVFEANIGNNHRLVITNKVIGIKDLTEKTTPLHIGNNEFGAWSHGIVVEEQTYQQFVENTKDNKRNLAYYTDGDKFPVESLIMTGRKDGDKFKPACRYKTKLVHHLDYDYLYEKDELPIVRDKEGNILYVHNVGFTDGLLPSKNTKKIYKFISY